MKTRRISLIGTALLVGASGVIVLGQRQSNPQPPPPPRTNYPPMVPMSPMGGLDSSGAPDMLGARMAEQQARSRNSERQRRLESDTEKLVGLVSNFKEQVQSDKGLSPTDLSKKAEEIEKLAKSVKDRMKG
ncbi:hypothetical protein [Edaphobacter aggregans]|uniref:hypothetical protein n=1 Tax=Edaphobacter aggregans TaxID=570835 RepID=UPI000553132D|nr:hypothetical protein [Edaphobacter aggregans]